MQYENIATDRHLLGFCDTLAGAESICFDTEFVSEHSYRPQLCLVQVVAGSHLAIIDPQKLADITAPESGTILNSGRVWPVVVRNRFATILGDLVEEVELEKSVLAKLL